MEQISTKRPYRFLRQYCKLSIFALALIALLILFPLSASARASSTSAGSGRIFGQLLNGTKKNAPLVGQKITLQMAQGSNASDLTNVTTDAHGIFSFDGLDTSKTINYAVYTDYEGAQYLSDLIDLSTKAVQQVNLTVYEATTSAANIAVVRATVLLQEPDAQKGFMTVSEIYEFKNLGTTTYVGSLNANGGKPNALRFSLPSNASKASLGSGFNGYQAIQVDPGFATNAAVPPGDSELDFSFQIPYTTPQYDFGYTVVYPTVQLSVFVPQDIHASSSGLNSAGVVSANNHPYHLFQGQILAPGVQVHLELGGLPILSSVNSSSNSSSLWGWIVIVLLIMLVILGITWAVYRSTRRSAATKQASNGKRGSAVQRDREKSIASKKVANQSQEGQQALLQELLDLDKAFEVGKIKKTEYQERRAKLKARLRGVMRAEEERRINT